MKAYRPNPLKRFVKDLLHGTGVPMPEFASWKYMTQKGKKATWRGKEKSLTLSIINGESLTLDKEELVRSLKEVYGL